MSHRVLDGAIFIADAHYPNHSKEFKDFLFDIKSQKIVTSQLFLMGDIFDLLVGQSSYLKELFKEEIALIDDIAKNIEVIYLEGNHDFNLDTLFKNVQVVSIDNQPLFFENASLSHGDKYCTTFSYKLYTKLIRNPFFLRLIPQKYAKYKLNKLSNKKICKKIENFEKIVLDIKKYYPKNLIIEGHFHQGEIYKNYIALPSFACSREYAIFKNSQIEFKKYIK